MFHFLNIITVVTSLKFVCQSLSSGGSKILCPCGEISWSGPSPYRHHAFESFLHTYSEFVLSPSVCMHVPVHCGSYVAEVSKYKADL